MKASPVAWHCSCIACHRNFLTRALAFSAFLLFSFPRCFCGAEGASVFCFCFVFISRLYTLSCNTKACPSWTYLEPEYQFHPNTTWFLRRDLDDIEEGLDQGRVREKEGVDSCPLTPGSSERHTMSRNVRLIRSLTVSEQDYKQPIDEEEAK